MDMQSATIVEAIQETPGWVRVAELPDWQKGRAIGRLLEQFVRSRPDDWKAVLHLLDAELGKMIVRGERRTISTAG